MFPSLYLSVTILFIGGFLLGAGFGAESLLSVFIGAAVSFYAIIAVEKSAATHSPTNTQN